MVDQNGAPSGEKYFVFYNPPVVNRQLGIRRSYLHETRRMAIEFIERHQQTLVFTNSRLATEVLLTYLNDACSGPFSQTIRGYRGGYLRRSGARSNASYGMENSRGGCDQCAGTGHRYRITRRGGDGRLSWLHRFGLAARGPGRPPQTASLAVLVASSAPLDQYIIEHPEYFFDRSPEDAHINADNLEILLSHLKCAAFELPMHDGE